MELNHHYHDQEEEEESWYDYDSDFDYNDKYKDEADWFTKLVLIQAELIHNAVSFLFSPVVFLMSVLSQSYHKAEETTLSVQSALQSAPSKATRGLALLIKKMGLGLFGAFYVCVVLVVVFGIAVVLGVGLVRIWVDGEPVVMRERLSFDYSEAWPRAMFWVHKKNAVPLGHTFYVSVFLLMPETQFNTDIGVFQISAELISTNGHVTAKSSLPCMLRFRSFPVRIARTFILSIPLLLGISEETQKISVEQILNHKEIYPRTEAIRVTMIPRAGTTFLPQIYGAEIVLKSKLPFAKELVRRWKWTLYVWASLYVYVVLVFALLLFSKPVFFPVMMSLRTSEREASEDRDDGFLRPIEEDEVSEFVRKWRVRRGKRKAESISATSLSVEREDSSNVGADLEEEEEEEVEDLGSVCESNDD